MRRTRILVVVATTLAVLLVIAGLGAWWFVTAGYPDYEEELAVEGLADEVEIVRDDRAVAHIRASNSDDLYFAQGYVHAQERLWQMDFQRRVVEGRLSELFGEEQLASDRFLRRLGLQQIAERIMEVSSDEGLAALERYAAGVNTYIKEARRLPFEFRLLGFDPEPWEPVHSVGMVALMAYNLGSNWEEQVARTALREMIDDELFEEILPPFDLDTPPVWSTDQAKEVDIAARPSVEAFLQLAEKAKLGGLSDHLPQLGSNSWVVAPERSANGVAMLANDPHLQVGAPILWYENRLEIPGEHHVYGWSIPGAPAVILGHNEAIAWGMTNTGNAQDLFLEEFHEEDTLRVRGPDGFYEVEVREELIQVDGRDAPDTLHVRVTRNGPVFQPEEEPPLSIRWTAHHVERSPLDAILQANAATDWESFREAFRHFTVPVQNLVYADVEGNIGFFTAGDLPIRRQGVGLLPEPGWDDAYGWEDIIPYDELPVLFNPPQGYIATANHRVTDDTYPYVIEHDHAPYFRQQRIVEQLEARADLTLDDFEAMQTDWHNRHAEERLPLFIDEMKAFQDELSSREQRALTAVETWMAEPVNSPDAAGATIFQTWYLELMREVFEPEMGTEVYEGFLGGRGYLAYNALEHLLDLDDAAWLPDGLGPPLRSSFGRTVERLSSHQGREPFDWRWDRVQRIEFNHVLGASRLLRPLVNRGPFPYGGDHMTVGRAAYALNNPFDVRVIAGVRFMMSMEQPIRARAVKAGGQSGHPRHAHSADQLRSWREGDFYQLQPTFDATLHNDTQTSRLRPHE